MLFLSLSLIFGTILTTVYEPKISGWMAVIGTSVVFGSTGIPMKSPLLLSIKLDSLVFSLYNGLGITLISIPLVIYLLAVEKFEFHYLGIIGSMDIIVITYFAFLAVRDLGYCVAPSIWCGIGMSTAFLWGALYFQEPISNPVGASFGIALLILGVIFISFSKSLPVNTADSLIPETTQNSSLGTKVILFTCLPTFIYTITE